MPAGIPQDLFDQLVRALLGQAVEAAPELGFDKATFSRLSAEWAEKRAGELIKDLSSTDQTILTSALDAARTEGWSGGELRDFLSSQETGAYSANRVATIARTERGFADNAGNLLGYKAAGFEYFVVLDAPGCLPKGHEDGASKPSGTPGEVELENEANGQIWTAEQVMEYLLGHPNCERSFRPATSDELEKFGMLQ